VTGVHGLQQVERLGSAHLAHDDAFRTHTQAVLDQVAHGDLAFALEVGRPGFQPDRVRLLQLQLGGVLAGDDAFVIIDELGEAVEQRGLAGAGAAGDQRVDAAAADNLEDLAAFRRETPEPDQLVEGQLLLLELADGERRAVDRERRHDHVDAGAVWQARVADRRGFVDAAADLADDALADVEQLLVVAEADAGALNLAFHFDVGGARAVHHDVGDVVAREQRLEWAVAEHVVANVVEQLLLLGDRHHDRLDGDDLVDDVADFLARRLGVELGELRQVDRLDQGAEDRALGLVVGLGMAGVGRHRGNRRRRGVGQAAGRPLAQHRCRHQLGAQPGRGDRRAPAFDHGSRARGRTRRGGRLRRRLRCRRQRCLGRGLRLGARRCGAREPVVGGTTLSKHATYLQEAVRPA
jgi:hypothetical protein